MNVQQEIKKLKEEKNAIILSHFYQPGEVQDIADIVGDSLELAKAARDADNDVIVFCGVRFMAETAKILNPKKNVLLPAIDAGCLMADMISADEVLHLKEEYPNAAVMCYVNSDIEVKAVSDICCTSSNAVRVAQSLVEDEIIFVPDRCLGDYISQFLPQKKMILAEGFCPTHMRITAADIKSARQAKPQAMVLVHPECNPEVIKLSDFVGSTSQIIEKAVASNAKEFIIGTEQGVLHRLDQRCPNKKFYNTGRLQTCINMKRTTIDTVYRALKSMEYQISVEEEMAEKAIKSLERMFSVTTPVGAKL